MLIFETCLFSREYGISKDSKVLILYFDFCQDKYFFFFTASKFKYCGSGLKKDLVVVAVFDLVLVVI